MPRVSIENCLKHINNRFDLVLVASKRAKDIATKNVKPLVDPSNDKPTVIALREIDGGYDISSSEDI